MTAAKISYLESLDNLLTALEMYRDVEKKTIQRMQEIMKEHGIVIEPPKVEPVNTQDIRKRLEEAREEHRTQVMVAEDRNDYCTPDPNHQEEEKEEPRCQR